MEQKLGRVGGRAQDSKVSANCSRQNQANSPLLKQVKLHLANTSRGNTVLSKTGNW